MFEPRRKRKPVALFILLAILILLAAAYFGMVVYFQTRYLFNTKAGSINCSQETPEYLEKKIAALSEDYLLTIYDRDNKKYYIKGTDIGYQYVSTGIEENILKEQNPLLWPKSLFQKSEYPISGSHTYDMQAIDRVVRASKLFSPENYTEPQNAYLKFTDSGYEIVPESPGSKPIPEEVIDLVIQAVANQEERVQLTDNCFEKPAITTTDPSIQTITKNIDTYLASTITYEFGDQVEELTSKDIFSMMSIAEDGTITIDEKKVQSFVQKMASKYNTWGDERQFTTTLGQTVTIGGGDYGWIIAKKKEEEAIKEHLGSGTPEKREPIYEKRARVMGSQDIGDTYVEIDYTNQHMYYYKESKLIFESDVVTGKLSNGNGSPDGIFNVKYKKSPSVLVGEGYQTKVAFFVVFAHNVGFHDATWQSSFGGNRYLVYGSHGCINMPYSKVAEFYEIIEDETPVVAYYREPVALTSESAKISNAYSYKAP